jgi:hypothetical protein
MLLIKRLIVDKLSQMNKSLLLGMQIKMLLLLSGTHIKITNKLSQVNILSLLPNSQMNMLPPLSGIYIKIIDKLSQVNILFLLSNTQMKKLLSNTQINILLPL